VSWKRRIRLYIERFILVVSFIMMIGFAWFIASIIDTNAHNDINSHTQASSWNVFQISQSYRK
jgi:hypothetical protein